MPSAYETFGFPVLEPDLVEVDLRRIKYFVSVAENLNFGQAAEELHLTQPALSRQIQALEHEVGHPLLERKANAIHLTRAGETLLREAREVLKRADLASHGTVLIKEVEN